MLPVQLRYDICAPAAWQRYTTRLRRAEMAATTAELALVTALQQQRQSSNTAHLSRSVASLSSETFNTTLLAREAVAASNALVAAVASQMRSVPLRILEPSVTRLVISLPQVDLRLAEADATFFAVASAAADAPPEAPHTGRRRGSLSGRNDIFAGLFSTAHGPVASLHLTHPVSAVAYAPGHTLVSARVQDFVFDMHRGYEPDAVRRALVPVVPAASPAIAATGPLGARLWRWCVDTRSVRSLVPTSQQAPAQPIDPTIMLRAWGHLASAATTAWMALPSGVAGTSAVPVPVASGLAIVAPLLPLSPWPVRVSAASLDGGIVTSELSTDATLLPAPRAALSIGTVTLQAALLQHAILPTRPVSALAAALEADPLAPRLPQQTLEATSSRIVELLGGLSVYAAAVAHAAGAAYAARLNMPTPADDTAPRAVAPDNAASRPKRSESHDSAAPAATAPAHATAGSSVPGAGVGALSVRLGRVGLELTEYSPVPDGQSWLAGVASAGSASQRAATTAALNKFGLHGACLQLSRPQEQRDSKLNIFIVDGGCYYERLPRYDLATAALAEVADNGFEVSSTGDILYTIDVDALDGCVGIGGQESDNPPVGASDSAEWRMLLPSRVASSARAVEVLKIEVGEHVVDAHGPLRFAPLIEVRRADRLNATELAGVNATVPDELPVGALEEFLRQQEMHLDQGLDRRAVRMRMLMQHPVIAVPVRALDSGVADLATGAADYTAGPPLWTRLSARSCRQPRALNTGAQPMLYVYFEAGNRGTGSDVAGTVVKVPPFVLELLACEDARSSSESEQSTAARARLMRFLTWWDGYLDYEPNAKYSRVLSAEGLVGGIAVLLAQVRRFGDLADLAAAVCAGNGTQPLAPSADPAQRAQLPMWRERLCSVAAKFRHAAQDASVAAEPAAAPVSAAAPAAAPWVHVAGSRISEVPLSLIGTSQRLQLLKVTTFVWLRSLLALFAKNSDGDASDAAEVDFDDLVAEQMHKRVAVQLGDLLRMLTPHLIHRNWV